MRITIKGKNGSVTESLKQYAEKKVKKLERYFDRIQAVEIKQTQERGQHIIELNMEGDGVFLRSEERCNDLHAAVDGVVDKMERQVKRFKNRMREYHRQPNAAKSGGAEIAQTDTAASAEEEERTPLIVRRKRFHIKPMHTEEAMREMELVDHDFFLFRNSETGAFNVLYRRHDGDYGLIEPEE
jgi:putative sigma-54 modulation protein